MIERVVAPCAVFLLGIAGGFPQADCEGPNCPPQVQYHYDTDPDFVYETFESPVAATNGDTVAAESPGPAIILEDDPTETPANGQYLDTKDVIVNDAQQTEFTQRPLPVVVDPSPYVPSYARQRIVVQRPFSGGGCGNYSTPTQYGGCGFSNSAVAFRPQRFTSRWGSRLSYASAPNRTYTTYATSYGSQGGYGGNAMYSTTYGQTQSVYGRRFTPVRSVLRFLFRR